MQTIPLYDSAETNENKDILIDFSTSDGNTKFILLFYQVEAAKGMSKLPEGGVVKFLMSKNANVNAENSRGCTPLHIATLQGNTEAVVQLLSKRDTKINVNNKAKTMENDLLLCYVQTIV